LVAFRKRQPIHWKGCDLEENSQVDEKTVGQAQMPNTWRKKILILCDSHGGVFEYIHDNQMLLPHYINCEVVGGATAYGLNNDYSVTRSFHKFCQAVRRFSSFDVIGIMLGEVDCCVTLWAVAQKRGVTPTSLIPHAMRGIQRVLDLLRENGHSKIVFLGSILPTVSDEQRAFQPEPMRHQIMANQRQRTELVLAFNQELEVLAKKSGACYLDITEETLDKTTGLVKSSVVIHEWIDHHQSQAETAQFWCEKLRACPVIAG
jgi:hypothetical protein